MARRRKVVSDSMAWFLFVLVLFGQSWGAALLGAFWSLKRLAGLESEVY